MPQDLRNLFIMSIDLTTFTANLVMAFICGMIIAFVYRQVYEGPGFSYRFARANVTLAMIMALVIMVIGNNLARAFGLVGAMSIIRFRTAVKDTMDIVFIFFALTVGMASGIGLRSLALFGTLGIGFVLWCLHKGKFAFPSVHEYFIQFNCTLRDNEQPYLEIFKKFCRRNRLINMQSLGEENRFELSYSIQLKDKEQSAEFIRSLKNIPGVERVRIYFDEENT